VVAGRKMHMGKTVMVLLDINSYAFGYLLLDFNNRGLGLDEEKGLCW